MGTEIERKFLVVNDSWKNDRSGLECRQGYLTSTEEISVRIRIMDDTARLNIKKKLSDIERLEYEYTIPMDDALEMLEETCGDRVVTKTRYPVDYAGKTWEVDVFHDANEGLTVAEIELNSIDESFDLPPWAGEEVSHDPRYLNVNLARKPYKDW